MRRQKSNNNQQQNIERDVRFENVFISITDLRSNLFLFKFKS